ncbi:MAG: hypothetical protein ACT4OO_03920 [Nitrospiraceae bacterium]
MPVNMDPNRKRRKASVAQNQAPEDQPATEEKSSNKSREFGAETEDDRNKAQADAEWKNMWDQTEVIDMDKW